MTDKTLALLQLATQTTGRIILGHQQWTDYLKTAARLYKYPFNDQVLIYAQRPEATACASYDVWNDAMHRYVRRGSKGIGFIKMQNQDPTLSYVFDIADTGTRRSSLTPFFWKVNEENEQAVTSMLETEYSIPAYLGLPTQLLQVASNQAADYWQDHQRSLLRIIDGTRLEGYDDYAIGASFRKAAAASIAYSLFSRCGLEPDEFFLPEDFADVTDWNTPNAVTAMGSAVSEINGHVLRQIEAIAKQVERSKEHERTELYPQGGLSASGPEPAQNRFQQGEQVRQDAAEVSAGTGSDHVSGDAAQRDTGAASDGSEPASQPVSGRDDAHPDAAEQRDGTIEGNGSHALDGDDEQSESTSGGSDPAGIDLQLNFFDTESFPELPSEDNQIASIMKAERAYAPFAFSVSQENLDHILRLGSNTVNHRMMVADFFSRQKSLESKTAFLKRVYHGGNGFETNQGRISVWYDEDGIRLAQGTAARHLRSAQIIAWEDVARRIDALLDVGQFATNVELAEAHGYEQKKLAESLWYLVTDMSDSAREQNHLETLRSLREGGFPEATERIAQALHDPEQASAILEEYRTFYDAYLEDRSLMRFRNHRFMEIQSRLEDLLTDRLHYTSELTEISNLKPFITEDEVDADLTRGSGVSLGKMRIHAYLTEPHTPKEKQDFLKQEYGIGGHSPALSGAAMSSEDHGGKGISYTKQNCDPVRMNWNNVVSRIEKLIQTDRYLSQAEKEELEQRQEIPDEELDVEYIRERLAEAGIENGEVVDPEKLENRPFIQEVQQSVQNAENSILSDEEFAKQYLIPDETTFEMDGRTFLVDRVNLQSGSVNFQDITFANSAGFPIFRVEPISVIRKMIEEADTANPLLDPTRYQLMEIADQEALFSNGRFDRTRLPDFLYTYDIREDDNGNPARLEPSVTVNHFGSILTKKPIQFPEEGYIDLNDAMAFDGSEMTVADFIRRDEPRDYTSEVEAVYPAEQNGTAFDIVVEKLDFKEQEKALPAAENFRITDPDLGVGGPKTKYQANIEAIKVLRTVEAENRPATPEEQERMSRYVGWGGLADAFDANKPSWANEYLELRSLLTPEEYQSAQGSTLNAHYTSPAIIKAIYEAVGNMGFRNGNILEPAMGVGNFFGMLPEEIADSRLYGVELDDLSGRIAKQLYPKADITVAGFETTNKRDFFDLAVGNVPFGHYQVNDRAYNKLGFSIHDYFFAKTLDQVRPGGVIAFVTSRYTMDKQSPEVRRYIAQRADLLGAIRLPNNAFKANAGTEVVSDILFFQKRESPMVQEPDWVYLAENKDGFFINRYFVDHPEMILGKEAGTSTPYGKDDFTVIPVEGQVLEEQLHEAVQHIHGQYTETELPELAEGEEIQESIPADPTVPNYSYAVVDGQVYFRENSIMVKPRLNLTAQERVKGMIGLRDTVRELMDAQLNDADDETIQTLQKELNDRYDVFTQKFGLINAKANGQAFSDDSSYYLLCSLEITNDRGELVRKADMFTKRTIKQQRQIDHVDTAAEALAVSIGERAGVDLGYMAQLTGKTEDQVVSELTGIIFPIPQPRNAASPPVYVTADEYLSGNVRQKLREAKMALLDNPMYLPNVQALEKAQPKDLEAAEIDVRLGATWVPKEYIQQFMHETLNTPFYHRRRIRVNYSSHTAEWNISSKSLISMSDVAAYVTYGTTRASAYRILEDTLNLRDVRIYDVITDPDGKEKRVLNQKETTLAQQKQQAIKDAFRDWVWKDPDRRHVLVDRYNELFNSTRLREFDGQHIPFSGMNPEIMLREHQRNAVAHILYGGNTLLAHEVGAGKTFEMIAAAMESKRLGLCQKAMFVVPNHLTEQWASEFLRLYPSANILVTTKKDFEKHHRQKFCSRIATGDYDAVIIGHSQFERIPISQERQERFIENQIQEITEGIDELKRSYGEQFTIKQLMKTKKQLEVRLSKLQADDKKDNVVTFEQLGVDRLYVDEAHAYKNLFLYTKMRNVAGLSTSEAQKSSDMFLKCRYMDEVTDGRGIVFATGTPVSNSMTELYTMQRYLQYGSLKKNSLTHFDAWASTFGETSTAIELAPEGTGYRARTRFAKFFNLPELMTLFKEVADIKTADQLHLPTPKANYETVVVKPSDLQQEMVAALSERAAEVHSGNVDPSVDNMLKITSDGRKLGLDQRLINPLLPDDPGSKVNACVNNIHRIWEDGKAERLTQLVFCDISTPKATAGAENQDFSVYDDIRTKLIERGVPAAEIAFIHDANTEQKKKDLFAKVRSGDVRVLLGSTAKMGAGTNVQDRLIALHDLDCPWRPGDLEQRAGRIVRQGNMNPEVHVYRYVTEGTFDAYLWQTIENKQKFISQIMSSKSPVRSCDDLDETALSYAEIKALCAGDPRIKEKMDLDVDVARLRLMKADHQSKQFRLEDQLLTYFPQAIEKHKASIDGFQQDLKLLEAHPLPEKDFIGMEIQGVQIQDKEAAGEAILAACKHVTTTEDMKIGYYRGFQMTLTYDAFSQQYAMILKGSMSHRAELGTDARGNLVRIENTLNAISGRIATAEAQVNNLQQQMEAAKDELAKPFPQESELKQKSERLSELDAELNMDSPKDMTEEKTSIMEAIKKPGVSTKEPINKRNYEEVL